MSDPGAIQSEFDRLAALERLQLFDHSSVYYPWILRRLPERLSGVAEIGCGSGALTALLAPRCERLVAVDLSPAMLDLARERCAAWPHVEFEHADANAWSPEPGSLDAVVSVATLHHLRPEVVLPCWAAALRPGGSIVIVDVLRRPGLVNVPVNALAAVVSGALRFRRTRRLRADRRLHAAWEEHARFDTLPTMREARETAWVHLGGASVRHRLFWRYSILWRRGPSCRAPSAG